jgi:hypothetical protein
VTPDGSGRAERLRLPCLRIGGRAGVLPNRSDALGA